MRIQLSVVGELIHLQAQVPSTQPGQTDELDLLLMPGETFGNLDYATFRKAAEKQGYIEADELAV